MTVAKIIELIPVGRENAVSREILAERSGMSDRIVRKCIESARNAGAIILNEQDGKGYYRVGEDDIDAIERQYRQDTARAMSLLKRRKTMRRILKEAGRDV